MSKQKPSKFKKLISSILSITLIVFAFVFFVGRFLEPDPVDYVLKSLYEFSPILYFVLLLAVLVVTVRLYVWLIKYYKKKNDKLGASFFGLRLIILLLVFVVPTTILFLLWSLTKFLNPLVK